MPPMRTQQLAGVTAASLAGCGGDDETTTAAPTTHTVEDVTGCFEDAGQEIRTIETSLAKIKPDFAVEGGAGSAIVWVEDDEAGAQRVVEQNEELNALGDPDQPQSQVVVSGNAVATISSASPPAFPATIEGCMPPS